MNRYPPFTRRSGRGFTLVEILIACLLAALIGTALQWVLRTGLYSSHQAQETADQVTGSGVFFRSLAGDLDQVLAEERPTPVGILAGAFQTSPTPDRATEILFWTRLHGRLIRVRYRYDVKKKGIVRVEEDAHGQPVNEQIFARDQIIDAWFRVHAVSAVPVLEVTLIPGGRFRKAYALTRLFSLGGPDHAQQKLWQQPAP